jgi:hypothetical protein
VGSSPIVSTAACPCDAWVSRSGAQPAGCTRAAGPASVPHGPAEFPARFLENRCHTWGEDELGTGVANDRDPHHRPHHTDRHHQRRAKPNTLSRRDRRRPTLRAPFTGTLIRDRKQTQLQVPRGPRAVGRAVGRLASLDRAARSRSSRRAD